MNPFPSMTNSHMLLTAPQTSDNGHKTLDHAPQINSAMSLRQAAQTILDFHTQQILANEEGVKRGDDPEALHQMRVATRRVQAALRDLSAVFPKETYEPLMDDVHWLSALLGKIRDLDVFIEWLEQYAASIDDEEQRQCVQQVIDGREAIRKTERAALLTGLSSPRYQNLKRMFADLAQGKQMNEQNPADDSLTEQAAQKIIKQLKRVRKQGARADAQHLKRLHLLRIEFKRLRYSADFFQNLFPRLPTKFIAKCTDLQDTLGDVHDANLHAQFLKETRRAQRDDPVASGTLREMIRPLRQEQRNKYKQYRKAYRRFESKKYQKRVVRSLEEQGETVS